MRRRDGRQRQSIKRKMMKKAGFDIRQVQRSSRGEVVRGKDFGGVIRADGIGRKPSQRVYASIRVKEGIRM